MNTLCPGFGLVLLLFCVFFLTDEILWDAWGNTCWTISTASTGTWTASDLRCLFTTQSQAASQPTFQITGYTGYTGYTGERADAVSAACTTFICYHLVLDLIF